MQATARAANSNPTSTEKQDLDHKQIEKLFADCSAAKPFWEAAVNSIRSFLDNLSKGVSEIIKKNLKGIKFDHLHLRSQLSIVDQCLLQARSYFKVDEPDSIITRQTFSSYRSIVRRAIVFGVSTEDAKKYNNKALFEAYKAAETLVRTNVAYKGRKFTEILIAEAKKIKDTRNLKAKAPSSKRSLLEYADANQIALPKIQPDETADHFVVRTVHAIQQWLADKAIVRMLQESEKFKRVYHLLLDLKETDTEIEERVAQVA